MPFIFATNGRPYNKQLETMSGIWFLDLRKPDNFPKALHGWISPTGIMELLEKNISGGNENLQKMSFDLLCDIDEAHRGYILDKEISEDEENIFENQSDYQSKYRSDRIF